MQFDEKNIQELLQWSKNIKIPKDVKQKWHVWKEKKQEQFLLYATKHLDPDEILLFQELPLDAQWKIIVKLQKGMIADAKTYLFQQIKRLKDLEQLKIN